jgi:diadenosine tetraphosphate (Ap4A) HIT family hydrolase
MTSTDPDSCTAYIINEETPETHCTLIAGHRSHHAGPGSKNRRLCWRDSAAGSVPHNTPPDGTCRPVYIGGEVIRVHGAGEMSDEARDALGALVDVARRTLGEEHPQAKVPDPERRERYAQALYRTHKDSFHQGTPWNELSPFWRAAWYDRADAAMALADAEHAELTQQPETPQPDCLFCRRDDPTENEIIAENERFYARLDNYPASPGHAQIVPKDHVVSLFDLTPDAVAELFELMLEVRSILDAEHPDGYTIGVNEGRAAGRTIDHLHVHLIPRYEGDVPDPRGGIRHVLPGTDPDQWSQAHTATLNREAANHEAARKEPSLSLVDDQFPSPEQAITILETAAHLLQDRARAAQHHMENDDYWKCYDPATAWADGYDNGFGGMTVPYVSMLPPQAGMYLARLLLTHASNLRDEGAGLWDAVALAQIIIKSTMGEAPRG